MPVFLSGRVMLSDGSALTERVPIERVCGATPHRETYTDLKGNFSFRIGESMGIFADSSESTPQLGSANPTLSGRGTSGSGGGEELRNCEIRAALPGFRSDSISLATRRAMDDSNLGTIVLRRLANVQGFSTSATSALAPKNAQKAFEKAQDALKRTDPDTAQRELLKAVDLYPRYAVAWFELGRVYERRDHTEDARSAYNKALEADHNYVSPYERLYLLAFQAKAWPDLADLSARVLRLNPYEFPAAYYYNAFANAQLQQWNAAEKSAREAAQLTGPQTQVGAHYLLGVILANKGDFASAAESLRTFLKADPASPDRGRVEKMITDVEQLGVQKGAASAAASQ